MEASRLMPVHIHEHLAALDRLASGEAVEAQIWILGRFFKVLYTTKLSQRGFVECRIIEATCLDLTPFFCSSSDLSGFLIIESSFEKLPPFSHMLIVFMIDLEYQGMEQMPGSLLAGLA